MQISARLPERDGLARVVGSSISVDEIGRRSRRCTPEVEGVTVAARGLVSP